MVQPHIQLDESLNIKYAILPGDPARVSRIAEQMEKVEELKDSIFIVFGCTRDAARFLEGYPKFKEVNYGGIAKKEGSKAFGEVVYLNSQEIADTQRILDLGISIYMQQLPTTKKVLLKL